jgi:hypothetical protein
MKGVTTGSIEPTELTNEQKMDVVNRFLAGEIKFKMPEPAFILRVGHLRQAIKDGQTLTELPTDESWQEPTDDELDRARIAFKSLAYESNADLHEQLASNPDIPDNIPLSDMGIPYKHQFEDNTFLGDSILFAVFGHEDYYAARRPFSAYNFYAFPARDKGYDWEQDSWWRSAQSVRAYLVELANARVIQGEQAVEQFLQYESLVRSAYKDYNDKYPSFYQFDEPVFTFGLEFDTDIGWLSETYLRNHINALGPKEGDYVMLRDSVSGAGKLAVVEQEGRLFQHTINIDDPAYQRFGIGMEVSIDGERTSLSRFLDGPIIWGDDIVRELSDKYWEEYEELKAQDLASDEAAQLAYAHGNSEGLDPTAIKTLIRTAMTDQVLRRCQQNTPVPPM